MPVMKSVGVFVQQYNDKASDKLQPLSRWAKKVGELWPTNK